MKKHLLILVSAFLSLFALPSFAAVDYSALTTAASFTDAQTAVLAIFALIAGYYVVIKGGKFIIQAIRGA